ncbi:MAG: hypothetical protein RSD32_05105 [Oscillospiraceae bacterium]
MNNMNFAKGMGLGMVIGSAIGMAVHTPKKTKKSGMASKALKAMGDIVENIGDAMSM